MYRTTVFTKMKMCGMDGLYGMYGMSEHELQSHVENNFESFTGCTAAVCQVTVGQAVQASVSLQRQQVLLA